MCRQTCLESASAFPPPEQQQKAARGAELSTLRMSQHWALEQHSQVWAGQPKLALGTSEQAWAANPRGVRTCWCFHFPVKIAALLPKANAINVLRCFYLHRSLILKPKLQYWYFQAALSSPVQQDTQISQFLEQPGVTSVLQEWIHITTFPAGWTLPAGGSHCSSWGKVILKKLRLKISEIWRCCQH